MRGKQLFHGIEIKVWAIACFVSPQECNDRALKYFAHQLMKISGETGMPIKSEPCFCKYAKRAEDVSAWLNCNFLINVLIDFMSFALGDFGQYVQRKILFSILTHFQWLALGEFGFE